MQDLESKIEKIPKVKFKEEIKNLYSYIGSKKELLSIRYHLKTCELIGAVRSLVSNLKKNGFDMFSVRKSKKAKRIKTSNSPENVHLPPGNKGRRLFILEH